MRRREELQRGSRVVQAVTSISLSATAKACLPSKSPHPTCLMPPNEAVSPTMSAAPCSNSLTVLLLAISGHSWMIATTRGALASPPLVSLFFSTIAARLAAWICLAVLRLFALLCAALIDVPGLPFFPPLPSMRPLAASRKLPFEECLLLNGLFDCFSDGRCECPPPLLDAMVVYDCQMVKIQYEVANVMSLVHDAKMPKHP